MKITGTLLVIDNLQNERSTSWTADMTMMKSSMWRVQVCLQPALYCISMIGNLPKIVPECRNWIVNSEVQSRETCKATYVCQILYLSSITLWLVTDNYSTHSTLCPEFGGMKQTRNTFFTSFFQHFIIFTEVGTVRYRSNFFLRLFIRMYRYRG